MSTNKAIIHDICVKRLEQNAIVADLNKTLKHEKAILSELDAELLHEMKEAQQTLTRVEGYTVSVTQTDVYTPVDWTEFYDYCEKNKCSYLFQRRLTQKAVAELLAMDTTVPVEKFTKHSISVRKVAGG